MRYVFEVKKNWVEWEEEQSFDSIEDAKSYGDQFSQSDWRIVDRSSSITICLHDPLVSYEQQASLDLERFMRSDRFINQMRLELTRHQSRRHERNLNALGHLNLQDQYMFVSPKEKVNWLSEGF
jgi:hypothetical protein